MAAVGTFAADAVDVFAGVAAVVLAGVALGFFIGLVTTVLVSVVVTVVVPVLVVVLDAFVAGGAAKATRGPRTGAMMSDVKNNIARGDIFCMKYRSFHILKIIIKVIYNF